MIVRLLGCAALLAWAFGCAPTPRAIHPEPDVKDAKQVEAPPAIAPEKPPPDSELAVVQNTSRLDAATLALPFNGNHPPPALLSVSGDRTLLFWSQPMPGGYGGHEIRSKRFDGTAWGPEAVVGNASGGDLVVRSNGRGRALAAWHAFVGAGAEVAIYDAASDAWGNRALVPAVLPTGLAGDIDADGNAAVVVHSPPTRTDERETPATTNWAYLAEGTPPWRHGALRDGRLSIASQARSTPDMAVSANHGRMAVLAARPDHLPKPGEDGFYSPVIDLTAYALNSERAGFVPLPPLVPFARLLDFGLRQPPSERVVSLATRQLRDGNVAVLWGSRKGGEGTPDSISVPWAAVGRSEWYLQRLETSQPATVQAARPVMVNGFDFLKGTLVERTSDLAAIWFDAAGIRWARYESSRRKWLPAETVHELKELTSPLAATIATNPRGDAVAVWDSAAGLHARRIAHDSAEWSAPISLLATKGEDPDRHGRFRRWDTARLVAAVIDDHADRIFVLYDFKSKTREFRVASGMLR